MPALPFLPPGAFRPEYPRMKGRRGPPDRRGRGQRRPAAASGSGASLKLPQGDPAVPPAPCAGKVPPTDRMRMTASSKPPELIMAPCLDLQCKRWRKRRGVPSPFWKRSPPAPPAPPVSARNRALCAARRTPRGRVRHRAGAREATSASPRAPPVKAGPASPRSRKKGHSRAAPQPSRSQIPVAARPQSKLRKPVRLHRAPRQMRPPAGPAPRYVPCPCPRPWRRARTSRPLPCHRENRPAPGRRAPQRLSSARVP